MPDRFTLARTASLAAMQSQPNRVETTPSATLSGIGFEQALQFIKLGYRASRTGWNGVGMWVSIMIPKDQLYLPYLMMKTAQDTLVPWLASHTDLLAHDWQVVDDAGVIIASGGVHTPVGQSEAP